MIIVSKQEIIEERIAYIVETYDNGTINKYIKSDPPEPVKRPTTGVQRGHVEVAGASVTIPLEPVDVSRATVSISGPVKAYMISNDALAVTLTEPGYINWEVRE